MAVPDQKEFFKPILSIMSDGNSRTLEEITKGIIKYFDLTESDLKDRTRGGKTAPEGHPAAETRTEWATRIIKMCSLIECLGDDIKWRKEPLQITMDGKKVFENDFEQFDHRYLKERYDAYREFLEKGKKEKKHSGGTKEYENMKTFLLAWNPENWEWTDLPQAITEANGEEGYFCDWTCRSKQAKEGDRAFLMRLGVPPKGIMGAGLIVSKPFKKPHYDPKKSEGGEQVYSVRIRFDLLVEKPIITEEELRANDLGKHGKKWFPQGSGVAIPENFANLLENRLTEITGDRFLPPTQDEITLLRNEGRATTRRDTTSFEKYFKEEFESDSTQYFIFDTGKKGHRDIDFEKYSWKATKYNLVKENDLFIYRKPKSVSENGKFYFFGVCKVGKIVVTNNVDGDQFAEFPKRRRFSKNVFPEDIESLEWQSKKKRKGNWSNFFSQYGMNKINKEEFQYILRIGIDEDFEVEHEFYNNQEKQEYYDYQIELENNFENDNYFVDDNTAPSKSRGAAQTLFSNKIKQNYNYECCLTGIKTKGLLVGSHIIPWSKNKHERLNPQNGLCLSSLADKCFDKGLISFTNDYRLILSERVKEDKILFSYFNEYMDKKIKLPKKKEFRPKIEFIEYHRKKIFN